MRRHRESQADIHARGVALDRRIEKSLDLGKGDDLVEFPADLGPRHAEDRAVQKDVFAAGQLRMKSGADFEQAGDAALDRDAALGRLGDARQDLQQGRFAGAVAADDAEDLASLDLEADIPERPELLDCVAGDDGRPRSMSAVRRQPRARRAPARRADAT